MLPWYATKFSTTEINYTFRRIPSTSTLDNWAHLTPGEFRFSLKAPQKITHFAKLQGQKEVVTEFVKVVKRLKERLGVILFQLPPSFACDLGILEKFLDELPKATRAAFEFSHLSWFGEQTFALLRKHQAALCVAESENLTVPWVPTTDFGYLRLRREDYTPADLRRWAKLVLSQSGQWREVFLYFKHEEKAVGPKFAAIMQGLLDQGR